MIAYAHSWAREMLSRDREKAASAAPLPRDLGSDVQELRTN
jgi:hypothetical protein